MNGSSNRTDASGPVRPSADQMIDIIRRFINPSDRADAEHDFRNVFSRSIEEVRRLYPADLSKAKVLVLGCGYHYPDVVLWSKNVQEAVGVDVRNVFWRNGRSMLARSLRHAGRGPLRSFAESIYKRRGYPSYYRKLQKLSGLQLDSRKQDLVSYDGQRLPFADGSFDIVCSNAVLEHVSDLGVVVSELKRVTKDQGLNHHLWHNFFSLSGAHVRDRLEQAHPWGHLLDDPEVAQYLRLSGTYLNKLRPDDVFAALSGAFVPLIRAQADSSHRKKGEPGFEFEGEGLLTPELEKRLASYPREELLTRAYLFVGRR